MCSIMECWPRFSWRCYIILGMLCGIIITSSICPHFFLKSEGFLIIKHFWPIQLLISVRGPVLYVTFKVSCRGRTVRKEDASLPSGRFVLEGQTDNTQISKVNFVFLINRLFFFNVITFDGNVPLLACFSHLHSFSWPHFRTASSCFSTFLRVLGIPSPSTEDPRSSKLCPPSLIQHLQTSVWILTPQMAHVILDAR